MHFFLIVDKDESPKLVDDTIAHRLKTDWVLKSRFLIHKAGPASSVYVNRVRSSHEPSVPMILTFTRRTLLVIEYSDIWHSRRYANNT